MTALDLDATDEPELADGPNRRLRAVWWLPLLLLVATEYKFRRRTNGDSLSGSLDLWIAAELAVYGAVGVYLLVRWKPRLRRHVVVIWMTGYALSTAVSAIYAPFPVLAASRSVQLVILLATVLYWLESADLGLVERFVHAYVVLITVSILIGMAYVAPTTVRQVGRFTWFYTHSVIAGLMLAISCTLLFTMWLTQRMAELPWSRRVYFGVLVFNVVALLRTETRGSIGAAAVAFLFIAALWLGNQGRRRLMIGLSSFVVLVALAGSGPVLRFLSRGEDAAQIGTFNRRTEIWSLAWESFLHRPIQGLGFTAARGVFFDETGLGGAHNAFVNVIVDVGLVGIFWWIGLLGLVLAGAWRGRRATRGRNDPLQFHVLALLGVTVCQIVNGMTTESLGAGVGVGGIFLLISAAWVVVLGDRLGEDPSGLRQSRPPQSDRGGR